MWVDQRLPSLQRHRMLGFAAAACLVAIATFLGILLPHVPPFLTFFPAVLLSAFLGGRYAGIAALTVSSLIAWWLFMPPRGSFVIDLWGAVSIAGFIVVGIITLFVVDLLDVAIRRLRRERERLRLALQAGGAAAWEWTLPDNLQWDRNFFELLGLDPDAHKPSPELFLARVHPADRKRMEESTATIRSGARPRTRDEFRIVRPDGQIIWVEHHRALVDDEQRHILGITQDITRRKESEQRIRELMRELAHRVKNQYAVILAMIRETAKQTINPQEFQSVVQTRISGLSKSHDLLVNGEWKGATIAELLHAQVEPFGAADRCEASGPPAVLMPSAVQYLGMAFLELATNSAKHGALSTAKGKVVVTWTVSPPSSGGTALTLTWREVGGPAVETTADGGFGRQVLERLAPAALDGKARLTFAPDGVVWTLDAGESAIFPPQ